MNIVIVGAGQTGAQLAKYLIQEKHDVSIIESDEYRARHISNRIDCMVIHDNGSSPSALSDAGIKKADALICLTGSDEINMIVCGLAASVREEPEKLLKIARVYNDDYLHLSGFDGVHQNDSRQILGIDHFIHPGMEVAGSIIRIIEHGVIGHIFSFSDTPYELGSIHITAGSALDGLVLTDYRRLVTHESIVTLVERENDVMLPSGSTVLKSGDRVHILADGKNLPEIYKFAGDIQRPIKKIGIAGGGKLGSLIAEGLLDDSRNLSAAQNLIKHIFDFPLLKNFAQKKYDIVIIEQDSRLCNELAARFPDALILNEDISDESFTGEEELDDLDCLITTTTNEELNIITAVYMKSRGIARTIALVTGSGHAVMARHLGVDVVIPVQSVVVDSILSHLMGSSVKEVRSLGDGNIDLIEIEIGKDAPVIDKPISAFRFSAGGLLLLVNRGGESFIPKGDYVFKEGDRIVLITRAGSQSEIEKYLHAEC
jgi:trk system potassium uptake protein TrkA